MAQSVAQAYTLSLGVLSEPSDLPGKYRNRQESYDPHKTYFLCGTSSLGQEIPGYQIYLMLTLKGIKSQNISESLGN